MNYRNGLSVWNGGSYDHCVDIHQAVIESRAAMCASSVKGSLLLGVGILRMLLVYGGVTSVYPQVRVAHSSDDRAMGTGKVDGDEAGPTMGELLQSREFPKHWTWENLNHRSRDEEDD